MSLDEFINCYGIHLKCERTFENAQWTGGYNCPSLGCKTTLLYYWKGGDWAVQYSHALNLGAIQHHLLGKQFAVMKMVFSDVFYDSIKNKHLSAFINTAYRRELFNQMFSMDE